MAQVTAAALASECKVLSHPASVDTIPTDGNKEDVVPMAMGAAWKLRRVVRNVQHVLAIELMCAAQGIDYRAPLKPGRGAARAHEAVRELVAPLERDRVLSPDIERLAQRSPTRVGHFTDRSVAHDATIHERPRPTQHGRARRPRAARRHALLQGMAAGSGAAHADEQPRPRGGRAAGRPRRLRRHRQGGAQLGGVRRDRRRAAQARDTTRRCSSRAANRSACFARTRGAARAHRQLRTSSAAGRPGTISASSSAPA